MREILCERLKEQRLKNKKTQEEMAELLDISRANYGYYENGKNLPPIDKILILANYFGVSVDYLVGNEKHKKTFDFKITLQSLVEKLEEYENENN